MDGQDLSMHVGSEGWPVWSDPTDELLLLILLRKLILVLIERCQKNHCICLLHMGLHSCRPVRVPMLTPVHCQKRQQWACEHQNWTTEQWWKVAWSDESCFLICHVDGRLRLHHLPGEHMVPGCTTAGVFN